MCLLYSSFSVCPYQFDTVFIFIAHNHFITLCVCFLLLSPRLSSGAKFVPISVHRPQLDVAQEEHANDSTTVEIILYIKLIKRGVEGQANVNFLLYEFVGLACLVNALRSQSFHATIDFLAVHLSFIFIVRVTIIQYLPSFSTASFHFILCLHTHSKQLSASNCSFYHHHNETVFYPLTSSNCHHFGAHERS